MTAQVAMFTSSCAVIAADSAVTISSADGGSKIYTGVEKIFPLSDVRPVAALAYGDATLCGLPWSTALSRFRASRPSGAVPDLARFAADVVRFAVALVLEHQRDSFTDLQDRRAASLMELIWREAQDAAWAALSDAEEDWSNEDFETQLNSAAAEVAEKELELWMSQQLISGLDENEEETLHRAHRGRIEELLEEFLGIQMDEAVKQHVVDVVLYSFTRRPPDGMETPTAGGLVVTGYGDSDVWPGYVEVHFDGVGLDGVRCWSGATDRYAGDGWANVRAFAQNDGIATIVEGIHPQRHEMLYSAVVDASVPDALADEAFKAVADRWFDTRTASILRTLDIMPIPDLCEVAESLVSVTGLLQRIQGTLETVGGPVTVGVLAPGEPLRWATRPILMSR